MAKTYEELLDLVLEYTQRRDTSEEDIYQEDADDVVFGAIVITILVMAAAFIAKMIRISKNIKNTDKRIKLQRELMKIANEMDAVIRLAKKGTISKTEAKVKLHMMMSKVEKMIDDLDDIGDMQKKDMKDEIRKIVDDFDKNIS